MSTFCHIWCTLCGGVLDTAEEDGTRRSRLEIEDLEDDVVPDWAGDLSPDTRYYATNTWTYKSAVLSYEDTEVRVPRALIVVSSLTTISSGCCTSKLSGRVRMIWLTNRYGPYSGLKRNLSQPVLMSI